ncbi:hypothetical protein HOG47_06655, partial [archaeon]|nr:hypothetical protein [archaeon]
MAKYILGVNGWDTRSHDTSATIIKCENGEIKVLAAAEEERFSRIKHAYDSLPVNAVQFCLNEAGITSEELYAVALSWDMPCLYDYRGLKLDFSENDFLSKLFGKMPRKKPKFNFVNHHLSHALSAYSPSGFQESNVMVIDGQGETESLSIWNISNNGVKKLASSGIHASLGYFYESLTEFIGFRGNQAGKTMGLAPYGNNSYFNTLRSLFDIEDLCLNVEHTRGIEYGKTVANYLPIDEQEQLRTLWFKKFRDLLKLSPNDNTKKYSFRSFPKVYRDIAASGQGA